MQIVIPLNGKGQRFLDLGYKMPKPLVKVLGKEIILHLIESLQLKDENLVLICNRSIKKYRLEDLLRKEFNNSNIKIVYLKENTRGASETVLQGLNQLEIKNESLLILDGDTIFNREIIDISLTSKNNIIFYDENYDNTPIYSYITDDRGEVLDIEEKVKISDKICIGAYFFTSVEEFKRTAQYLINNNITQHSEFYISGIYKQYCIENKKIISHKFVKYNCLGTPLQLQNYSLNNDSSRKFKFVVDIDNTLQSFPLVKNDYSTVEPILETINFIKNLKNKGHYIILYTARRMKTHDNNVGKVIADISEITITTLKQMGIPYDEIIFGKPHADFYIDDLAINCFDDLPKSTGFYFNNIESRPFHEIVIKNDIVEKRGDLLGEYFWYSNCPKNILEKYFPKFHHLDEKYIVMDKIKGISMSYIYTGAMLTETIFDKVIDSLKFIHNSADNVVDVDIQSNYINKLQKRWNENRKLYNNFPDVENIYQSFIEFFKQYKSKSYTIIHGDPVFSNIFYDTNNNIKFIDVRGKQGDAPSLMGDISYDFAKIYQSLCGYDYILLDKDLDQDNIERFTSYAKTKYGNWFDEDIKYITKSLLFSMLPLHKCPKKINNYFKLMLQL